MSRRHALGLLGAGAFMPLVRWPQVRSGATNPLASIHYMSLREVARLIQARDLSPVELTRHMLDRIDKYDATLESYATITHDQALADARAAEREIRAGRYRGPLHGVPIALKDLFYTKGIRTMGGSLVHKTFVPSFDSTVAARLHDAGAVMLGKLNTTEAATAGYSPTFGVPRNPWNIDYWPGLSSSGSGVATAAGLCFASLGTDTGGSIRFPSSANGIVGLKPTYGRVSRFGVLPFAESLDHVGPMARSAGDVAIMFDAIAGRDSNDATSLDAPPPNAFRDLTQSIRGVRIGIDRKYALEGVDAGDAAALEEALRVLKSLGAEIVEVRMPDLSALLDTWVTIATAEMVQSQAATYPSRATEYGPYMRTFLAGGAEVTSAQIADARKKRVAVSGQFDAVLESVDAMACPAGGSPAWRVTRAIQTGPLAGLHAAWGAASPRAMDFTGPMDLAGTPAICLPSGFSPDGLPYSIQLAGRRLSEPMLCRIANAYEEATSWHARHPDLDGIPSR
jgi:amidase